MIPPRIPEPRRPWSWLICLCAALALPALGQELEPRAYSPSPVGTNVLVISLGRSNGDVLIDPSLPLTDIKATIDGTALGYFHSFGLAGRSASVAFAMPYVNADVTGNVGERSGKVERSGLGDAHMRFALNLYGGPAMSRQEYAQREPGTAIGTSLSVIAPTGEYDPLRLVNISANRWAFKPEIGITRSIGHWFLEASAGAWLFTDNTEFLGTKTRSQATLWTTQIHAGYTFAPDLWLAADATYYTGGRTSVNGVDNQDLQENTRFGLTLSVPINRRLSSKIAWSDGVLTRFGGHFTTFSVALQYRWFDR